MPGAKRIRRRKGTSLHLPCRPAAHHKSVQASTLPAPQSSLVSLRTTHHYHPLGSCHLQLSHHPLLRRLGCHEVHFSYAPGRRLGPWYVASEQHLLGSLAQHRGEISDSILSELLGRPPLSSTAMRRRIVHVGHLLYPVAGPGMQGSLPKAERVT